MINLSKEIIDTFESEVRDQILPPSGPNYDEVREIWNAMIQRHPALLPCRRQLTSINLHPSSGMQTRSFGGWAADNHTCIPTKLIIELGKGAPQDCLVEFY
jgi:hypothetical protein